MNVQQRAAVEAPPGPVMVLAGPGTGKTYVITQRLIHLLRISKSVAAVKSNGASQQSIHHAGGALALTFTNKAAKEMADRVNKLSAQDDIKVRCRICTFHALCCFLLRAFARRAFQIASDKQRNEAMLTSIQRCYDHADISRNLQVSIRTCVERWKGFGFSPAQVLAHEQVRSSVDQRLYANVYAHYQRYLHDNRLMDFGDLTLECVQFLEQSPAACEAIHRRWAHVLVDEFQDTSYLQWKLVRLLTRGLITSIPQRDVTSSASSSGKEEVSEPSLTVVGDPNQCIYTWRLASAKNPERFLRDFPSAKLVHLSVSYRSTPRILRASNAVIRQALPADPQSVASVKREEPAPKRARVESCMDSEGEEHRGERTSFETLQRLQYECLTAQDSSADGPKVAVMLFSTPEDEAKAVASLTRHVHGESQYSCAAQGGATDHVQANKDNLPGFSSSRTALKPPDRIAGAAATVGSAFSVPSDPRHASSESSSSKEDRSFPGSVAILGRYHATLSPIETALRDQRSPYKRIGVKKALDRPDTKAALSLLRLASGSGTDDSIADAFGAVLSFPASGIGPGTVELAIEAGSQTQDGDQTIDAYHAFERVARGDAEARGIGASKLRPMRSLVAAVRKIRERFRVPSSLGLLESAGALAAGAQLASSLVMSTGIAAHAGVEEAWLAMAGFASAVSSIGSGAEGSGTFPAEGALPRPAEQITSKSTPKSKAKVLEEESDESHSEESDIDSDSGDGSGVDPDTLAAFSCLLSAVQGAVADWWRECKEIESISISMSRSSDPATAGLTVSQPPQLLDFVLERVSLLGGADVSVASSASCSAPQITLSTIHASKGLEYDTVIIPGLIEGVLPPRPRRADDTMVRLKEPDDFEVANPDTHQQQRIQASEEDPGLQEERRLLYVAMTRAKRMLVLTHHDRAARHRRRQRCPPSRFLAALESLAFGGNGEKRRVDVVFKDCRRAGIRPASSSSSSSAASSGSGSMALAVAQQSAKLAAMVQSSRRSGQRLGQGDFRGSLEDVSVPVPVPGIPSDSNASHASRPRKRSRLVSTVGTGATLGAGALPVLGLAAAGAGSLPSLGASRRSGTALGAAGALPGLAGGSRASDGQQAEKQTTSGRDRD